MSILLLLLPFIYVLYVVASISLSFPLFDYDKGGGGCIILILSLSIKGVNTLKFLFFLTSFLAASLRYALLLSKKGKMWCKNAKNLKEYKAKIMIIIKQRRKFETNQKSKKFWVIGVRMSKLKNFTTIQSQLLKAPMWSHDLLFIYFNRIKNI